MLRVKGLGTCDNGRQDQHQHHPPEPAPARAVRIHAQQHKRERGHPRAHSTLASNRYDDSSLRGAPVRLSRVRAVLPVRGPPRRAAPSASLMKPREKDGRRSPPTRIRPREHGTCAEARPDLPLSPRTHLPIAVQGHAQCAQHAGDQGSWRDPTAAESCVMRARRPWKEYAPT